MGVEPNIPGENQGRGSFEGDGAVTELIQGPHQKQKGDRGANLVEYLVLVLFLVFIAMVSVKLFGQRASTQYSNITDSVKEIL